MGEQARTIPHVFARAQYGEERRKMNELVWGVPWDIFV